jgi:hypothetical protein
MLMIMPGRKLLFFHFWKHALDRYNERRELGLGKVEDILLAISKSDTWLHPEDEDGEPEEGQTVKFIFNSVNGA